MTNLVQAESLVFEQRSTVQSWDSDYYHPIAERYYDSAVKTMLELMGVPLGARVLDAGCGPGVHSVRVALQGHQVCAMDISQTMLHEAMIRLAAANLLSRTQFRQEDLTRLTFADGLFYYAFSWGVIIHIPEVEKALDELVRVLAKGGKLALYVTNQDAWDHKIERLLRRLLRKPLSGERHALGEGTWYEMGGEKLWLWRFDIVELERQMAKRGLKMTYRLIGELSEIQRRVKGPLRRVLLHLNNLCFRLKLSPKIAVTNLLVFEKTG